MFRVTGIINNFHRPCIFLIIPHPHPNPGARLNLVLIISFSAQFLNTGNDIAARQTCPCIWIINPRETGKVLQHVINYGDITPLLSKMRRQSTQAVVEDVSLIVAGVVPGSEAASESGAGSHGRGKSICVYTGEVM
jgi:hypothetical protein